MAALLQAFQLLDWWIWLLVGFAVGLAVLYLAETQIFRRQLIRDKDKTEKLLTESHAELARARLNFERVQVQSNSRVGEFNAAVQARNSLQAALDAREQQVASLSAQLKQARADYLNLHRNEGLLDKKLSDAHAQARYLQDNLEGVQNERSALLAQLGNYQEDIASMANMIKELQRDREKLVSEALERRNAASGTRGGATPGDETPGYREREYDRTAPGTNGKGYRDDSTGEVDNLRSQLATLRTEHDAAQEGRAAIEKQLATLRGEHAARLQELDDWRARFDALEQEHRQLAAEQQDLVEKQSSAPRLEDPQVTARVGALQEANGVLDARLQQARFDLDAVRASRAALEIEHDKAKQRLADLQMQLESATAGHTNLAQRLSELETNHTAAQTARADLEAQFAGLDSNYRSALSELDDLRTAQVKLQAQYRNAASDKETSDQKLAQLAAEAERAAAAFATLHKEREQLDSQMAQVRDERQQLESRFLTLAREHETGVAALAAARDSFEHEQVLYASARRRETGQEDELAGLKHRAGTRHATLDRAADARLRLERDHGALVQQLAVLESALAERERERASLGEQLAGLQAEHASATNAHHALRTEYESAAEHRRQLEISLNQLEPQLLAAQTERDALASDKQSFERELADLRTGHDETLKEREGLLQQLERARAVEQEKQALTTQLQAVSRDLEQLHQANAGFRAEVEQLNQANAGFQAEVEQQRTGLASLRGELDSAARNRAAAEQQVNALKSQIEQLGAQLESSTRAHSDTAQQLNGVRDQATHLRGELDDAVRARGMLEQALNLTRERMRDLERDVKRERAQRDSYLEQITTLTDGATHASQTIRELQKDKDELADLLYQARTLNADLQSQAATTLRRAYAADNAQSPPPPVEPDPGVGKQE